MRGNMIFEIFERYITFTLGVKELKTFQEDGMLPITRYPYTQPLTPFGQHVQTKTFRKVLTCMRWRHNQYFERGDCHSLSPYLFFLRPNKP